MRFSTIAVTAFAGAAIAAPYREDRLIARGKLGVNQIDTSLEKRMGIWAATGLASLGTWVGGKMGLFKRDGEHAVLSGNTFTMEEVSSHLIDPSNTLRFCSHLHHQASAHFAEDAVEFLSKKAKDNEAVICVDVPYTVENDSATHDVGAFTFEGNGIKSM